MKTTELSKNIKYAFIKSLPVMAGYIFLGIAFGIVLSEAGFGTIWALIMSVCVYAGSMQFVMVPMLASMVSPLSMAITAFFVNSRHMFYGLSFTESFSKMKTKPYMIFALTDETYSVLCGCRSEDPKEEMRAAWFLIALFDQLYWITGSIIGNVMGQVLPIDFTGIDFSMTALFVVILTEQILSGGRKELFAAAAGLGISVIALALLGARNFLLPALIITVLIVLIRTGRAKE